MAQDWENQFYPAASTFKNALSSISLFVLLDLLGAKDWPRIPSYFLTTHWAYQGMAKVEKRMRDLGLLQTKPPKGKVGFLPDAKKAADKFGRGFIEDDHIPFMQRGVPILHLIPSPFPEQWHDARGVPDDAAHLDIGAVDDWAKIVTAFTAEWMELGDHMPKKNVAKRDDATTTKVEL